MQFLGIDLGSSSVKLAVLDGETGQAIASIQYPQNELQIQSPNPSWAEQDPDTWWNSIVLGCKQLFAEDSVDASSIAGIGIAYQMHGLVLVDKQQKVLRPSIIWCDSRAVEMGEDAFNSLGADYCFEHLLNSPGNFTASKLRWVQQNEPAIYSKIHKAMLPGDFIAMKLSGEINTTAAGLSEGTLWDFKEQSIAQALLTHWGIDEVLLPNLVPNVGDQGEVSEQAAQALGLNKGVKICYRAGDQPNNALSLNVLEPGEIAATAGTSGVIYAVTDKAIADKESRVNIFLHVSNQKNQQRNGVLVCVNGAGRSYSWLRQLLTTDNKVIGYEFLNELSKNIPIGSDGLIFHPFGNGAERILNNQNPGAQLNNIDLNRHTLNHVVRATQEGIVFALNKGFDVVKSLGGTCNIVRVAHGNLFLSKTFTEAFVNTTQTTVELVKTDGAEGAARAAAVGDNYYSSYKEAFKGLRIHSIIEPNTSLLGQYQDAYQQWQQTLPRSSNE